MCAKCDAELAPIVDAQLDQLDINLILSGLPPSVGFNVLLQTLAHWRAAHTDLTHPETDKPLTDGEFLDMFLSGTLDVMARHDPAKPKAPAH